MVPEQYLTTCTSLPKYWASGATLADRSQAFTMPIPLSHVMSRSFLDCLKDTDIGAKIIAKQDKNKVNTFLQVRKKELYAIKVEERKKTVDDFNRGGMSVLPLSLDPAKMVAAGKAACASSAAQSSLPPLSKSDSALIDI